MKTKRITHELLAALLAIVVFSARAASVNKADNGSNLESGTSWVTGSEPTNATDIATWDATVATPANCTNVINATRTWGGIQVLSPSAPVKILTNNNKTLSIGSGGIDLGSATTDLWLALSVAAMSNQTWNLGNQILTLGETNKNVTISNLVAVNGHLLYMQNLKIQTGGTLLITNSATTIEPAPGAFVNAQIFVGNDGTTGNSVLQTAGTVKLKRGDSTLGNPKTGMSIGGSASATGVYTITGGSLLETSQTNTVISLGDSNPSSGTLNVDGANTLVQVGSIRLGNNANTSGTLNITNGTVIVAGPTFDVGRSATSPGGPGTVNLYGGTLTCLTNMAVPHGIASGTVNVSGGALSVVANLNIPDSLSSSASVGSGTINLNSGSLSISNNLNFLGNNSLGGNATVNLNGGSLTIGALTRGSGTGGGSSLVFNGGTLKPRANTGNFLTNDPGIAYNVMAPGANIDTAGFNITIPANLANGTGGSDGGLMKLGAGTLTLSGANTYNGPTTVAGGALAFNTPYSLALSRVVVSNSGTLDIQLTTNGPTVNLAALTLGTTIGGAVTNQFDMGTNFNPTVPLLYATNLTATGAVYVNITGDNFGIGTYHLIQYNGSLGGNAQPFSLLLVPGAVGYVTNNTVTHFVDLVVTSLPQMVWRAQVNTNWDIKTTVNWVDLGTGLPSTYPDGATVFFNDTATNSVVYLTTAVAPAAAIVNNASKSYTFIGVGKLTGVADFNKMGSGTVTMSVSNDYSGLTVISNGTFRLGTNEVIPNNSPVTLEGKLDLAGFSETAGALSGNNGIADNSGPSPAFLSVGNGGGNGTFSGRITNSGAGSLALDKGGNGTLVLSAVNGYSGGTTNHGGGLLQLASVQSIGSGPLTLSSGTLAWTGASPHLLTNALILSGNAGFGLAGNGLLTIPGIADCAGGGRTLTCTNDVLLQGGITNGGLHGKNGPSMLTVRNSFSHDTSGSMNVSDGTLILDNCTHIQDGSNFRVACTATNGISRLAVTNSSALLLSNSATANLRLGAADVSGAPGVSNIIDLSGTIRLIPYAGVNNRFLVGGSDSSAYDILNMLPGSVLEARQITNTGASTRQFNIDGGTILANTNDMGASFLQGIDVFSILDGGLTIDTGPFTNIAILQSMQSGGSGTGGLTKVGTGTLLINAPSSFTGRTLVSAGTLGGSSSLNSPVFIASGAALAPGDSIGTFTINNSLTLSNNSTTIMEVSNNGGSLSSDRIFGVTTLKYAGTLVVRDLGPDPQVAGNSYTLFTANTYSGSFSAYSLPTLPLGLVWDTTRLTVDGTLSVKSMPMFTSITVVGTNLVMSGSGGTAGNNYYVLSSTDVGIPVHLWPSIATYQFGDGGSFSFTNSINPSEPKRFFSLQLP